jgi:hypothetical protein
MLALLMYLQFQEIVDVNIRLDKVQSSVEAIINMIAANATAIFSNDKDPSFMEGNLGIPASGSVTAGFVLGITSGVRMKDDNVLTLINIKIQSSSKVGMMRKRK